MDVHDKKTRSYNMSQIKGKDTKLEEIVRKYLFLNGFRYYKNDKRLPGKPDIVLPKYKTVIFVNGCFWHKHKKCKYFVWPQSNKEFWRKKIQGTVERDLRNKASLQEAGWKVITVWECELKPEKRKTTLLNLCSSIRNPMNRRSFYSDSIECFLEEERVSILGKMEGNNPFDLTTLQRFAWREEISILKDQLQGISEGRILLEYTIPRMGKRVDAVLLYKGLVILLEFKVGDAEYKKATFDQVLDYALDLKNFQSGCSGLTIVPIAVSTKAKAPDKEIDVKQYPDGVLYPLGTNRKSIRKVIDLVAKKYPSPSFDYVSWERAEYMPTPTIVEAAQALYRNHKVEEISRSDAKAQNLTVTLKAIKRIITESKSKRRKSIIFVTGVPGAGKTLIGLNLASESHNNVRGEHAVFLSGNLPLVSVLQEALTRDKVQREAELGHRISKSDARREVKSFIQIIHHYRDEYIEDDRIPTEHIVIFDESQRSWTKEALTSFMEKKKGIHGFTYSEPEFLISTMDRLNDWGVIVCLVGGGQEINKGEAGMPEWFDSLRRSFPEWYVYTADNIKDQEYLRGCSWDSLVSGLHVTTETDLYLNTSVRSFRSENVSALVKYILDNNMEEAQSTFVQLKDKYPICITRDLNVAKSWVQQKARGSERYGILASSNAARLKPCGIVYANDQSSISPENWFLNPKDDLRSSCFLEAVASEFETQGLELDYAIIGWDADFRIENGKWVAYQMSTRKTPPDWSTVKKEENILFMKNAYRVLLTRARQGFVIFIPEGSDTDITRKAEYYDATYEYLKKIGLQVIPSV